MKQTFDDLGCTSGGTVPWPPGVPGSGFPNVGTIGYTEPETWQDANTYAQGSSTNVLKRIRTGYLIYQGRSTSLLHKAHMPMMRQSTCGMIMHGGCHPRYRMDKYNSRSETEICRLMNHDDDNIILLLYRVFTARFQNGQAVKGES